MWVRQEKRCGAVTPYLSLQGFGTTQGQDPWHWPRKLSNVPGTAGCVVGGTASTPGGTLAGCPGIPPGLSCSNSHPWYPVLREKGKSKPWNLKDSVAHQYFPASQRFAFSHAILPLLNAL